MSASAAERGPSGRRRRQIECISPASVLGSESTARPCHKRGNRSRDDLDTLLQETSATFCSEETRNSQCNVVVWRRRDSGTSSQTSTTSSGGLSRYFHKAKSFGCLAGVAEGAHGESAIGLQKSLRPAKKRRHTHTDDEEEGDDGSSGLTTATTTTSDSGCCCDENENGDGKGAEWEVHDDAGTGAAAKRMERLQGFNELCKSFESIPVQF